jgi:hypothetical protein
LEDWWCDGNAFGTFVPLADLICSASPIFGHGEESMSAVTRAAEKIVAMEETADSSGLKPLGMTIIKGLQWRT